MARPSRSVMLLFLVGVFSQTHIRVIGSIGISELFMFLTAPFIFVKNKDILKRHGFSPMLILALMTMLGCYLSSLHNDTPTPLMLRGLASTYAMFALPVVYHHLFKDDMVDCRGFKWYCIGATISGILTIFGMHSGVELSIAERTGDDIASNSELFFMRHFGGIFTLPLTAFYQNCPTWLTLLAFTFPTFYTICTTSTGRGALLLMGSAIFMLVYVNRKPKKMKLLYKRILAVVPIMVVTAIILMQGYKYAAMKGYLTEAARQKYERQTKGGTASAFEVLKNGRGEFFIGLMAASESPFWGYGPWPVDRNGIYEAYLYKYGDQEAIDNYTTYLEFVARNGGSLGYRMIPAHSFVVGNWVYYGLLGLPFWLYVLWKILQLLKYLWAVPAWFGYFAFYIPTYAWAIFFSPLSGRDGAAMFLTLVLLAIAAGKGKVRNYTPPMVNNRPMGRKRAREFVSVRA